MPRKIDQLFFEIRAQVEGLSGDLDDATRQLGKLETFISAHPVAAAAALSAALVEIGKKAVEAAEETDTSMRAIAASLGLPIDNLKELEDRLDSIAIKAGRATSEIQAAAVQAAQERPGTSPQDIGNVVEAATLFSDATNTQLSASISLLDQVMREFHVSSADAVDVLAQIDAAAKQGHVSVESLAQGFVSAAPTVVKLGLDLNTTLRAVTAMAQAGLDGQKVGRIFRQDDIDSIKEWADRATLAANATEQLTKDAETARGTASRTSQAIRDELNIHLRELGDLILPPLNKGLGLFLSLLEGIPKIPNLGQVLSAFGPVAQAFGEIYSLTHQTAPAAPPLGSEVLRGLGNPSINGPAAPEPLTITQKTQIANDLASIQKLVTDFGNSTNTILSGVTHSAVDASLNELETFSQKFDQARTEIENKLRQLQSTTPNLPKSVADSFNAQLKALADTYASGIQARLDNLNNVAAKEADDIRAKVGQALGAITGDLGTLGISAIQQQNNALRAQIDLSTSLGVAEKLRLSHEVDIAQLLEEQKAKADAAVKLAQQVSQAAAVTAQTDPNSALTSINAQDIKLHTLQLQLIQDGKDRLGLSVSEVEQGDGYKELQTQIVALEKQRLEISKGLSPPYKDVADSLHRQLQDTIEMVRAIGEGVTAALQLGEAFGVLDARAGNILKSIAQVAANIPALAKSIETFSIYGENKDLLNVVGSAVPVVGGIASLISTLTAPNPQEQAHIKALQENSVAIANLTSRVASITLSGNALAQGSSLVDAILSGSIGSIVEKNFGHGAGVDFVATTEQDFEQLQELAKSLGVAFDGTKESLIQLQQAAQAAAKAIGKLPADVQGTTSYYSGLSTAEGLTGVDKFNVDALGLASQSPFLAQLLGGFDLNTQAGRDAAQQQLLAAYQRGAPSSSNPFTSEERGGLNIQQLEQGILQWMQELSGLPPLLGDATTATDGLSTAAGDAAAAIQAAAQKIADADSLIDTAADILGTPAATVIQQHAYNEGFNLDNYDLTTDAGRQSAIDYLTGVFKSLDPNGPGYADTAKVLDNLIKSIRGLPPTTSTAGAADAGAATAAAGSSGAGSSTSAGSNAATVATQSSVDRMGDYLATLLEVNREELALWTKYLTGLTTPIITGPLIPPRLPAGFGGGTAGVVPAGAAVTPKPTIVQHQEILNFNLDLHIDGSTFLMDKRDSFAFARQLADMINVYLGDKLRAKQRLNGDTSIPGQ